jgi:hypothetical protein
MKVIEIVREVKKDHYHNEKPPNDESGVAGCFIAICAIALLLALSFGIGSCVSTFTR